MPNVTLSLPENLYGRMKLHREIRWSSIIRSLIEQKIKEIEMLEKITKKSKLTMENVFELEKIIKREVLAAHQSRLRYK